MNCSKESVLIVEDDGALREALTDTLKAAGIGALAAGDAGEALKQLDSRDIALVISDVQMPGPSGYDIAGPNQSRSSSHNGVPWFGLLALMVTPLACSSPNRLSLAKVGRSVVNCCTCVCWEPLVAGE